MKRAARWAGLLALWCVVACGSDTASNDMDAGAGDGTADGADDGSDDGSQDGEDGAGDGEDGAGDGEDGSQDGADGTGDGSDADAGIDAGASDGDAGADDDAGPGDDFPFPEERGFALGEDWLVLVPDTTGSGNAGGRFGTTSRGAAANLTRGATIYVDFREPPETGDYTVADSRVFAEIQPGTVVVRVNDAQDMSSFWYADGTGGTVHVNRIDEDTLDVVWKDIALIRTAASTIIPVGTTTTSASGWYTVAPGP